MTKRKPTPTPHYLGENERFRLVSQGTAAPPYVLGTVGASFRAFDSAADLAKYLRGFADSVEREWAQYVKERANITSEEPTR